MRSVWAAAAVILCLGIVGSWASPAVAADIVHDAEYYVLKAQNGERWTAEDKKIEAKLAELRNKYDQPPNIVYLLWDDTAFGAVGFPALQKNFGYETPNINRMAAEGINFTRMYTEPSCTPTRAAMLTGRHPVRHGMGVVGMPHEFSGLRAEEVTIAEVLSEAGYATAFCGKGHLGDIEESYLHNQGFDEALFTPMNQITSLYDPMGGAVNAVLGLHPEISPPDPYQLDRPGLVPEGWVMNIEGKKGEQGAEWCGTSNECFEKLDTECEQRILEFIRRNAKAGKPFHAQYWPNFLNFLAPEIPKRSVAGLKVPGAFPKVDAFVGQIMAELKELGIAENTLFVAMADNGPMVHSPPPGWGMLPMLYRGGKGDFTEGGVRTPAFAWWPGTIETTSSTSRICTRRSPDWPARRNTSPATASSTVSTKRPCCSRATPTAGETMCTSTRATSSARRSRVATSATGSAPAMSPRRACPRPTSISTWIPGRRTRSSFR
jgi:arylsulfatase